MRNANPKLIEDIKKKAVEMLMEKEPEEITMRDIAKECGVTATTLYYYYSDKDALFEEVKLESIAEMNNFIKKKLEGIKEPMKALKAGLSAFRDWTFKNPRIAILFMGRLKPNKEANKEQLQIYYQSNYLGKTLLDAAVKAGKCKSRDTLLDSSLIIAALWGAIESVLLNRTLPEYWGKGILFTDRMIELCCREISR
ncbi:TetR/AcrR family transcriptional regulator [Leadbettera azotonutricia]|uniref:Transcriptional regulator, TetR family n=1 Tax=Leadbettera azotonutricia (strain ATCC BAA-888 / DSM 13862 / ZAS-9) TaxID=545695 RepID=F5Y9W4_LEAAZ|nr:TetR/AcrR family transcriptional regulator [Leadbettera azotonutricia]AEF82142.1 transcriptional regulator, TetR family [Leadbettera azotonutricia ZAS-9]